MCIRERFGGSLASPMDEEESNALVRTIMAEVKADDSVWLGGKLQQDFDWRWSTGVS